MAPRQDPELLLSRFHIVVGADDEFSTSRIKTFHRGGFGVGHVDFAGREPTYGRRFENDERRTGNGCEPGLGDCLRFAAEVYAWNRPAARDLFSGRCRQMLELGGDCYDFAPLQDDQLAVSVGDASGKSVGAALMISNVQSSLRTVMAFGETDPAAGLRIVNRQVYASSLPSCYATLFYGILDGPTRTLRYVNAGHNPPVVIRQDCSVAWLETGGAPLGMFGDANYQEGRLRPDPGDLVVAYTDGVIEAVNSAGEEWGVEGLLRVAPQSRTQCADDIVHAIFTLMDEYSRGRQTDDATVVVARAL